MKKSLTTVLSLAMTASLAACGGSGTAATPDASASAPAEETAAADAEYMSDTKASSIKLENTSVLTKYTNQQVQTMDYVITANAEDGMYNENFIDGLVDRDVYKNTVPCAAESWEMSEDGTEYTFHIRPGIQWVTSTNEVYDELKAQDFVDGLRHGVEFGSATGWLMDGVVKYYAEYEANKDYSDEEWAKVGVKALDDYTLVYTLEQPTPYFASMARYAVMWPINREFLESKGEGCKLGAPDTTNCAFGTTAADSILYNGPFIMDTYDQSAQIIIRKNENYWDKDNVFLDEVKYVYDDGSDPYSTIRAFEQGYNYQSALSAQWENFEEYVAKYDGYTQYSLPNSTCFGVIFNFDRLIWDETNYATTDEAKENTHNAILNTNFRRAVRAAYDRSAYLQVNAPKEIADATIRNINNDTNIVRLSDGTTYGDLVTAAYDEATGTDVDLSDGQDPFLSKDEALKYIEAAKEEGVVFPVHLDMLVNETNKAQVEQGLSMKKSIEENTDSQIIIELVMRDEDTVKNIAYYNMDYTKSDYDISTFSGWSPDYADPKSFVDIYSPSTGYYMAICGLTDRNCEDYGVDDDIKDVVGFTEYERLYREADAIVSDLDARYLAFAKADAKLVEDVLFIPSRMQTRSVLVTHQVPFTTFPDATRYKGLKLQEGLVTTEQFNEAYDKWQKGELD